MNSISHTSYALLLLTYIHIYIFTFYNIFQDLVRAEETHTFIDLARSYYEIIYTVYIPIFQLYYTYIKPELIIKFINLIIF